MIEPTGADSLRSAQELARALARRLGIPTRHLQIGEVATHDGGAHLEVDADGTLHRVVTERGQELSRRTTDDVDELLYWVFEAATFGVACDWEVRHRVEGEDVRIGIFRHQFDLLDQLDPTWTDRRRRELGPILDELGRDRLS